MEKFCENFSAAFILSAIKIASETVVKLWSFKTSRRMCDFSPFTNCQSAVSSVTNLPNSSVSFLKLVTYESSSPICLNSENVDSNFRSLSLSLNYASSSDLSTDQRSVLSANVDGLAFYATYHHVDADLSSNVTAYYDISIDLDDNPTIEQYCSKLNNQVAKSFWMPVNLLGFSTLTDCVITGFAVYAVCCY